MLEKALKASWRVGRLRRMRCLMCFQTWREYFKCIARKKIVDAIVLLKRLQSKNCRLDFIIRTSFRFKRHKSSEIQDLSAIFHESKHTSSSTPSQSLKLFISSRVFLGFSLSSLHLFLLHHFMAIYFANNRNKNPSTDARFLHHIQQLFSWFHCMNRVWIFSFFCYYFEAFQPFTFFSAFSNTSTQSIFMLFLALIFPINIILFSLCCLFFSDCVHLYQRL